MSRGGWKTKKGADLTPTEREKKRAYERKKYSKWSPDKKGKHRQHGRNWIARNLEKSRKGSYLRSIKRWYGLSPDQYQSLFDRQKGKCAICGCPHNPKPRVGLRVDHDHTTNTVRGLLCPTCNTLVGYLEVHASRVPLAQVYLQRVTARSGDDQRARPA